MDSAGPTIVISGAGGWVFPLELARDILSFPALTGSRLVLYDVERAGAERTQGFVRRMVDDAGLAARVDVATDLRSALAGADVVITVFQVGGVEAYAHDVLIPRRYGVDQTVGDTLGPGGIFRGLRTVQALREVADAMLELCPDALLLNYANPMSINCWATERLGVNIVGLCHSVQVGSKTNFFPLTLVLVASNCGSVVSNSVGL
jgi:alpha-galactosidase